MSEPERLCLLQVHAHPDDEASKGAGTTAKYAAEGVRNVLVCCTGGEAGDILNPRVDTPETRTNLFEVRLALFWPVLPNWKALLASDPRADVLPELSRRQVFRTLLGGQVDTNGFFNASLFVKP